MWYSRGHERGSRGQLPAFWGFGNVMVAKVRKSGGVPRLVQMRSAPWTVAMGGSEHVYVVEKIVTRETLRRCMQREMHANADSSLVVGARKSGRFPKRPKAPEGEFEMVGVVNVSEVPVLNTGCGLRGSVWRMGSRCENRCQLMLVRSRC